jgi:hypothetical protein
MLYLNLLLFCQVLHCKVSFSFKSRNTLEKLKRLCVSFWFQNLSNLFLESLKYTYIFTNKNNNKTKNIHKNKKLVLNQINC